jgi:hypothetical protein
MHSVFRRHRSPSAAGGGAGGGGGGSAGVEAPASPPAGAAPGAGGRCRVRGRRQRRRRSPSPAGGCIGAGEAARAAASLAQPASLAPSFSFALLASLMCRSRCRHHLRRSWPAALLAPLAPLAPLARCTLACVTYADGRASACACACVLAFASVRVRMGCVRAGCPGAIGQAAGPGRPLWSWLPLAVAQVPAVQMPALAIRCRNF